MKLKPLKDRLVVTFTEEPEKTAGGLYMPEGTKDKPQDGTVEAVGPDVKDIKVGDVVLFDVYSGSKIKTDEQDILIIKEEDVLAIVEG